MVKSVFTLSLNILCFCLYAQTILCGCAGKKADVGTQKNAPDSLLIAANEKKDEIHVDTTQVEFGASIEGYKTTPLGLAVYSGDTTRFQELIKQGASIEKCLTDETYIFDILYTAFVFNKIEFIRYILANKLYTDANETYTEEAETPLTLACSLHDSNEAFEIAQSLIDSGANVDGAGESGGEQTKYPIIIAVNRKNFSITKLLIDHGAKKNVTNALGETPLVIAQKNGIQEIVDLLSGN
jgi:ankyrin repeat protein